jgi:hypothetical protein
MDGDVKIEEDREEVRISRKISKGFEGTIVQRMKY